MGVNRRSENTMTDAEVDDFSAMKHRHRARSILTALSMPSPCGTASLAAVLAVETKKKCRRYRLRRDPRLLSSSRRATATRSCAASNCCWGQSQPYCRVEHPSSSRRQACELYEALAARFPTATTSGHCIEMMMNKRVVVTIDVVKAGRRGPPKAGAGVVGLLNLTSQWAPSWAALVPTQPRVAELRDLQFPGTRTS